uniref:C-type natriuretic peptide 1 n=1 Tax=Osmerus mordax TaxID=8014 RepID=C1BKS8_OSMMO|nr:C-type natriuretic peptide 1 precursor [Osmerus mordax]
MLCPVLLCATLVLLPPLELSEGRALHPSPEGLQFVEQFLERCTDLLNLDDLENAGSNQPEEPSDYANGVKVAEYPKWADLPAAQEDSAWLRLLKAALANQKRAEPDRSRRAWNRGCFGLKLDRIGSMSGLGC